MAAGVAHEIRNPLNGIEGFASLLARDLEPESRSARHAQAIVSRRSRSQPHRQWSAAIHPTTAPRRCARAPSGDYRRMFMNWCRLNSELRIRKAKSRQQMPHVIALRALLMSGMINASILMARKSAMFCPEFGTKRRAGLRRSRTTSGFHSS